MDWLDNQTEAGGNITKLEMTEGFMKFCDKHGLKYNEALLKTIELQFDEVDQNNDGQISRDQFISAMGDKLVEYLMNKYGKGYTLKQNI